MSAFSRPESSTTPRRLPATPPESVQAKRISRPLPKIPRALIPPDSRTFRGFSGKASLFTETQNVFLAKAGVQLMATGAHTMQEITCANCSFYLGWKIVRAHESSESWKDGHSLLELENLFLQSDLTGSLSIPPPNPRRTSTGSNSDTSDSSF
ncbi:Protein yippee-like [Psilocybe cubensis]|uniref:Protein yippee-like n=1 Tax=Psilocybe cubensis TaxID=181762 RepID=A0ACB8HBK0_PSICU|nr:Protein yippee-like [Psilocybe cubensis]KAH9485380.1 Protein yippee-like [Psilocybe cubensis]